MRRRAVALAMLVLLAGCGDSTQDVAVVEKEPAAAKPDTTIVSDSVSIDVFMPDNPVALAASAQFEMNAGVQMGFDRLSQQGFVGERGEPFYMRAITTSGRVLESTWFPGVGADDRLALIGYVRMGDREFVVPIVDNAQSPSQLARDVLAPTQKGEWGPSRVFLWGNCGYFVMGLYQACLSACHASGLPPVVCRMSCAVSMVAAWLTCILFESVG